MVPLSGGTAGTGIPGTGIPGIVPGVRGDPMIPGTVLGVHGGPGVRGDLMTLGTVLGDLTLLLIIL